LTKLSPVSRTCRGIRSAKDDGQLAPHMIATTTTANAPTEHPDGVQAGHPRPAASIAAVVKFVASGNEVAPRHLTRSRRYWLDAAITEIATPPPRGSNPFRLRGLPRASQVVGRNSGSRVITGQPNSP
jgi:hypothetical protein